MFKKCVSSVLAFGMALSLGFSSFVGNVSAEQSDTAKGPAMQYEQMSKDFEEKTNVVSEKVENTFTKLVEKNLADGKIKLESLENSNLDLDDVVVRTLDNGDYFVKVSTKGENATDKFSGFSVIFNGNKELVSVFEVNLNQLDEDTAALKTWSNGQVVTDVVMEKPDVQPQWSYSYFENCLSAQGVPWATVAALGFICGAACAATGGAGCAPCLYAGSSITGGTIGYCLGQALNH
ncbi:MULTISPECIES: hypothetical protein [Bacillus cereus group]|uniref:Uncharacterized protein n=2 Tax=Bacillus cereus group TaxID=86661 RepID=A0A9W5QMT5_BACCE|nr:MULTISPECIES: hypothetical protein [Bacillus cereus group]EOP78631.1 hypothetical protein IGM_06582 [Bacillus cereus HuB4-4]OUB61001.1 hypothetical protein BK716_01795 [Bacillus thuringiensis serovar higo]